MDKIIIFVIVAVVVVVICLMLITAKRNRDLKEAGLDAEAVVTRIWENTSTDPDTLATSTDYAYFVTYRTENGETVEARLASGKSVETYKDQEYWYGDLHEGSVVRIKYLPDKPDYVIRIKD
jgi:hypothetical protein